MRKRRTRRDDQAEVNMTPMLDIVFILLIFFIVTATFLNEEGINLQPPPACEGEGCGDGPAPIVIQVDAENRIFVAGDLTDLERVLAAVNRQRAEHPDSAVLLETDDAARHGTIVRIWDDMRANNLPVSIQRRRIETG